MTLITFIRMMPKMNRWKKMMVVGVMKILVKNRMSKMMTILAGKFVEAAVV